MAYDKLCERLHKELCEIEKSETFTFADLEAVYKIVTSIDGIAEMPCPHKSRHFDDTDDTHTEVAYSEHNHTSEHLSMEEAKKWTSKMKNADGTTGPHWTPDQTNAVMAQRGISCNKADFYAAMNMMYSDYGMVAKAYSADNQNFYADMAAAFLNDKDAAPGKIVEYLDAIVDG